MPSERRLHPLSILFGLGAEARELLLPGFLVLVTAGATGLDWEAWLMLLLIPYAIIAVGRYASFRYRYEENELVIRSGFIFRNERHVPYARIQNLDAVQNVFHRLAGVVEVRIQTGGGDEPEATMRVLPVAALEEMRQRVLADRGGAAPAEAVDRAEPVQGRELLHLSARQLMLFGLIENRGVVVIAAAFGLLWELGLLDRIETMLLGEESGGRGVVRALWRAVIGQGGFPLDRIAIGVAAFAGLLLFIRLISMGWALVRLGGFRVSRVGDGLRMEFGLFTRVVATIPIGRIQAVTFSEGPLHRLFGRVSVRVETAGGHSGESSEVQREWLAPIIGRDELAAFVAAVLPELDPWTVGWQPVHPRAFRRAIKEWIAVAAGLAALFVVPLGWWDVGLLALLLVWAAVAARGYVRHLGWAVGGHAVYFRSGWIWRQLTAARLAKIQAVAMHESPFDRRHGMSSVRVDTAGAGDSSHRVDIPYLAHETAAGVYGLLARQASQTAFKW